jgi:hypothetical protein
MQSSTNNFIFQIKINQINIPILTNVIEINVSKVISQKISKISLHNKNKKIHSITNTYDPFIERERPRFSVDSEELKIRTRKWMKETNQL